MTELETKLNNILEEHQHESGLHMIGGRRRLIERLLARGDQPVLLTRQPDTARQRWGEPCIVVAGDPTHAGEWMQAVKDCDAVVHLAGENLLGRRWNAAFKELLPYLKE